MSGILTNEGLNARAWYVKNHPIRMQENRLERVLRAIGLNTSSHRPSGDEILKMYRGETLRRNLREQNPVYQKTPERLKGIVGYVLDVVNTSEVNSRVMAKEIDDEAAERSIVLADYGG